MTTETVRNQRAPFDIAIMMAEAAHCENISWWNQIRSDATDAAEAEYLSSRMLALFISAAAHRDGIPAADVWARIRETGELPL